MDSAPATPVEQQLAEVCGALNQAHAQLVELLAAALVDGSWQGAGIRSPEHWLVLRAGLSPGRARALVALARRRAELPAVMTVFGAGQLSVDQVGVVAAHTPAGYDASVAELAVHASVPQLRRALSRYAFDPTASTATSQPTEAEPSEDAGEDAGDAAQPGAPCWVDDTATPGQWADGLLSPAEQAAGAPAELTLTHADGRFTLRLSAPADTGALIETALQEARDALFQAGHPHPSLADALTDIATRSLTTVTSARRRDAYRIYVHLDTDGAWLTGRPALPAHLRAKLTCDGALQPLWHTDGSPIAVGRTQRIVPDRTRRLVEDRDRGCRFPGCTITTPGENHHIIHWADGGPTDPPNLLSLCPWHHDAHHRGDYTISGNADDPLGLTFTDRHGRPITGPTYRPPPGGPPTTGPGRTPPPAYTGPTGQTLHTKWVTFTPNPTDTAVPA